VFLGCVAIFALLVVVVCRTPLTVGHDVPSRDGWRFAAEAGIIVLGMLLFSERTWKHHCVTLALPFAVLCYRLAWVESTAARVWLIAALASTIGLMTSTSVVGVPAIDEFARLAQIYGTYVWAFIILTAALAVLLWQTRPVGHVSNVP
jgi:hypothetical protein